MSKPSSGHFSGTFGDRTSKIISTNGKKTGIIKEKTDYREHPRKSLTSKQRKEINEKIKNRTATKEEYKRIESDRRFNKRRKAGVENFWKQEKRRIMKGLPTTRPWNSQQRKDIIIGNRPKYNGKTIQGHHTYSASKYPHLANKGELIFPVTFDEHLNGWHGGNFKNDKPGQPINYYYKHNFKE